MIKSLLLVLCATFVIASTVSADAPTPTCVPGCAVNQSAR